jgi:hypothetical protein
VGEPNDLFYVLLLCSVVLSLGRVSLGNRKSLLFYSAPTPGTALLRTVMSKFFAQGSSSEEDTSEEESSEEEEEEVKKSEYAEWLWTAEWLPFLAAPCFCW